MAIECLEGWIGNISIQSLAEIILQLAIDKNLRYHMKCQQKLRVDGRGTERVLGKISDAFTFSW